MVDLEYVKKKKRRRVATILGAVGTIGVVAFIITSFLGKNLGNFTIELKRNSTQLALSTDESFEESSTYLGVRDVPVHVGYYYADRITKFDDAVIDSASSNGELYFEKDTEGNKVGTFFFKYTFFIKNTGVDDAYYNSSFDIVDVKRDANYNYDLSDILRVQIYNNDATAEEHDSTIYAKHELKYSVEDETKQEYFDAPVCIDRTDGKTIIGGYATPFYDDSTVARSENVLIKTGEMRRLTVVMWLELSDEQATGSMPKDTSLKLAMNIEAVQAFQEEE